MPTFPDRWPQPIFDAPSKTWLFANPVFTDPLDDDRAKFTNTMPSAIAYARFRQWYADMLQFELAVAMDGHYVRVLLPQPASASDAPSTPDTPDTLPASR